MLAIRGPQTGPSNARRRSESVDAPNNNGTYDLSDPEQLAVWAMDVNLNEIIHFHNYIRGGLSSRAFQLKDDAVARSALENYNAYLAANTFMMIYAYVEEFLYLRSQPLEEVVQRKPRDYSITRYRPILDHLGVSHTLPSWQFLVTARAIRHCLLHANGRVSHMTQYRSVVTDTVSQFKGELDIQHDRLRMNTEFVARMAVEVREFRTVVEQALARYEQQPEG